MARNNRSGMPTDGINTGYARNRVQDLNNMFSNISLLQQSIDDDRYEKELENLRKLQKYKKQILKDELKEEEQHQKKLEAIRKKYQGKALKEALDAAQKEHDARVDAIVDEYEKKVAYEEKIEKQYKGKIGGLVGDMKKSANTGGLAGLYSAVHALGTWLKQFDNQISEIAGYQNKINTRLNGSGRRWDGTTGIANRITSVTGSSPYVKTSDVMKNVNDMVATGIAYNVEMRAFLQTVKESVATTFDATNGTLLQLIRIQQADTTASRLGMEAALNSYLNSMFQTTEYLSDVSTSVKSAMYEATSLMTAQTGIAFEYQVQKWLGSLYSVGMSSSSVSNIASALGQLGSGDFSSLSGSGMQNLLVMAAGRAGLSYGDLLIKGLDESNTNKLLQSMVDYLASIATDNRVVQSAYARIFGLSSSDIKAATNLASDTKSISGRSMGYAKSMLYLNDMMNTMATRVSMGGMLETIWDNIQYSMSEGIASNPALYAIYKAAGLLDELAGGIPIPSIGAFAMGNGTQIDLETTVADIMRVGALGGSLLGSIGKLTSSLSANILPGNMLAMLGIGNTLDSVTRGSVKTLASGISTAASIFRGNQSSGDVYESMMTEGDKQKEEAYERTVNPDEENEEDSDIKLKDLNATAQSILEVLESVISGGKINVNNDIFTGPFN